MAVLVGNETYTRFVFDPEEGETKFVVSGETVAVEDLEEALKPDDARIERMIVVPNEDARKINVVFKPLKAYDKHAIQDITSESGLVAPGSQRRLLIKRAVVSWDYDVAWSEAILDQLDAGLEEQIFAWISWGIEPLEQDQKTGQAVPLEEEKLNREQRRATKKKTPTSPPKDTPPTTDGIGSTEPEDGDSTS